MQNNFKPRGYNSVSPYFIIKEADRFIALMQKVFDAKLTREYKKPDGSIMHAELQIDDSIIMLGEASDQFPAVPIVMHVYVAEVEATFQKAIDAGCEAVEKPKTQEGDPDKRGSFKDYAGNWWSVATQMN